MNDIAVITRFHYLQDGPDYRWRFDYYAKEVLPRLLAQTDQGFDLWVWCEPWQDAEILGLSPRINIFRAAYKKRDSRFFIDYTHWEDVTGLPKYKIQIGLDSDDLVRPDFIAKVRGLCAGPDSIHVGFQPLKLDVKTGKKYRMDQYTHKRGSPIFAFYQPGPDFKFAYHTSHLIMPTLAQHQTIVPEGLVFMTIHDRNDSTGIKRTDKPWKSN
jgi:hypothetical protein